MGSWSRPRPTLSPSAAQQGLHLGTLDCVNRLLLTGGYPSLAYAKVAPGGEVFLHARPPNGRPRRVFLRASVPLEVGNGALHLVPHPAGRCPVFGHGGDRVLQHEELLARLAELIPHRGHRRRQRHGSAWTSRISAASDASVTRSVDAGVGCLPRVAAGPVARPAVALLPRPAVAPAALLPLFLVVDGIWHARACPGAARGLGGVESLVVALCVRGPVPRRCGNPLLDSRCLRPPSVSAAGVCIMYIIIFLPPCCVFSPSVFGPQPPVVFIPGASS